MADASSPSRHSTRSHWASRSARRPAGDPPEREARSEVLPGPLPPGAAPETAPGFYPQREVANADRVAPEAGLRIGDQDERLGNAADGVFEAQVAQLLPEGARRTVGRIREDDASRQAVGDGALDHGDPELRLGLELYRVGDACLFPP